MKIKTTELLGVEPGLLLTSIVDNLAMPFTQKEIKKISEYGFKPLSKKKTHFGNDEYTIVKFCVTKSKYATGNFGIIAVPKKLITSEDVYYMLVDNDDYEFSLHNTLKFIDNPHLFEKTEI